MNWLRRLATTLVEAQDEVDRRKAAARKREQVIRNREADKQYQTFLAKHQLAHSESLHNAFIAGRETGLADALSIIKGKL